MQKRGYGSTVYFHGPAPLRPKGRLYGSPETVSRSPALRCPCRLPRIHTSRNRSPRLLRDYLLHQRHSSRPPSFLANYTVHEGPLSGLGGNFGVRFVGTAAGDSANTIFIPNYTLFDGALRYGWRNTLFSINATNLADRRYVATCTGTSYCGYGYARNVIGSAKYRF